MPRTARKISRSGFYHVIIRGVNKQIIFSDDNDKKNFLHLLKYYSTKLNCIIHAYCLMDNHVHILIEDNACKLGELMRNITSVYALEYNQKSKRVGHLFQDRFKSQCIEDDDYLLRAVRYIHRNPEKADICKTNQYKWSSYREFIYGGKIINRSFILSKFNNNIEIFASFTNDITQDKIDNVYFEENPTKEERTAFVKYIINNNDLSNIKLKSKKDIKEIIKTLKDTKKLTVNEISEEIGISKNIINKI